MSLIIHFVIHTRHRFISYSANYPVNNPSNIRQPPADNLHGFHVQMRTVIHETLKALKKEGFSQSPLASYHLYREAQNSYSNDPIQITTHLLKAALGELAETDEVGAEILRMHFLESELIQTISSQLNLAEGTIYNRQTNAISKLAIIIEKMEKQARDAYFFSLENRLPTPSYEQLVGIEQYLLPLTELLVQDDAPWIVALVGIGGIGKTSLANFMVRKLIADEQVHDVGWVTAKQQTLSPMGSLNTLEAPALTADALVWELLQQLIPGGFSESASSAELRHTLSTYLEQRPHLIVVDNLETVQDVETLFEILETLANPSKFLLTTRESLHDQMNTHNVSLKELTNDATLALIHQEAQQRNLSHLLAASDEELSPIVETVGGNPLALRLVIGQTHVHALNVILENLRNARGQKAEDLYTYIYRQAWDSLSEVARRTLLVMPLVTYIDATQEHIAKVSQLDPGEVMDSLEQLVRLSLVDSQGGLNERRYSIHSLTRSFLHEQVIRWG
ncbi:MAG: NB-ARC domain-containing protein [Chloroflexota bacterium]